jgi:hypothetical protein
MSASYAEFLEGNDPVLDTRGTLHRCPVCAGWSPAELIADVSGVDEVLCKSQPWACDACWSNWQRHQLPLSPEDDFVTAEEWFCRFLQLTGRQAGNRDPYLGRQYALEADRLRGALAGLNPGSDEAAMLQVRLDKVIARSTLPAAWDKMTFAADGVDAATLSGVPNGTEIECDGVIYVIDDGDFSLVTSTPGEFVVTARHPRYIWQTWSVYAG